MEKQFVPYELAVKLKELGFDEPCFGGYDNNEKWYYHPDSDIIVDVPLWQQAFDFFIYNYGLISIIETNGYSYIFKIQEVTQGYIETVKCFSTHQQASHACLEKLIELVKGA